MAAATVPTAQSLDASDTLAPYRDQFHIPTGPDGQPTAYLNGNSLGLQCHGALAELTRETDRWAAHGVGGWHDPQGAWLPYHEHFAEPLARLVGALPREVVAMGALSTNLHLLLASFYQPRGTRDVVVMEAAAFPSDLYAIKSHLRLRGVPEDRLVLLEPLPGEATLRTEAILTALEKLGPRLALVLLGGVNYLTGQFFDLKPIVAATHRVGGLFLTDLAHAIGNVPLALHDWQVDGAAWCSYKYLNGGPGAVAGLFVHERHLVRPDINRLEGWWGHDKATRFAMPPDFLPIPTAEAWQISTPSILSMAPLRGALQLFDQAGLPALRAKSVALTQFALDRLAELPAGRVEVLTPLDPTARGSQLSLRVPGASKAVHQALLDAGVVCDFRSPDIIRIAPAPLYNSFADVERFVATLARLLG
ncbi:MAG: kynureninase [Bacteroidia bacterium]|nr:kynureninase [Bacteroidia bacterium]